MAKLKFGSMDLDVQSVPKPQADAPAQAPVAPAELDLPALLEKLKGMMSSDAPVAAPVAEPVVLQAPAVDLQPLLERIEATEKAVMIDMMSIDAQLEDMTARLEKAEAKAMPAPRLVTVPDVKTVTHVRDVSADALKQCEYLIEKSRTNLQLDLNAMKTLHRKQKLVNIVLGVSVILTILLHFA